MRVLIAESHRLVEGINGDIAGGASTSRVKIDRTNHVSVVVRVETAAAALGFKIQEHDAASGGNTNDVVRTIPVYVKAEADAKFSKVESDGAAQVTLAGLNGTAGLVQIEIDSGDLTEGFEYVSIAFDDPGAAREVCAMYLLDSHNKPGYLHEL